MGDHASPDLGRDPGGSSTLRIRLLGGLELRQGGIPLRLESARAESLLAYLLLHRAAPQSRQHLGFLLWPDSTESQARTNLRHLLHHLRRAVPDIDRFLDASPGALQRSTGYASPGHAQPT